MSYITFQPSDYFNTLLYSGNGSTQSITGVGFQPDLIWGKNRSATWNHILTDAVRGANKQISSNLSNAESSNTGEFTAFGSDGFSVGTGSTLNGSGNNIVSWNWKANGQGSSNTDGSINTTYTSANTTSGFSISTYTGTGSAATIGHGLGVAPKWILVKRLSASDAGVVYHSAIGATKYLTINSSNAEATSSAIWNDTAPTTSVLSIGTNTAVNASGSTYVAYCFAEKKGFSAMGSYVANGEASDNAFIYTGFKVGWVMIKATDVDEWRIYDNKRANPFNVIDVRLKANSSDAESSGNNECDFLSNGIKIRSNSGGVGSSGQEYIYMAFAEAPLVSSNGVPAVAR